MTSEDTQTHDSLKALQGGQIARAAGLVMIGFLFSRILGLVRESVVGGIFGAGSTFEAYAVAARPPDTVFYVVAGGALASAFIPTFTDYLARGDRDDAWHMASTVINLLTILMIILAALGAILALPIVRVLTPCAPGAAVCFDAESRLLAANLMRIMMLSPILFGISGLQMGILNTHQRFLLPALAPSMYNIGIIFGAAVLSRWMGIYGLAWGVVLGAGLHLLVQLPGLFRVKAPYQFLFDYKHPGVREILRLMGPRVLGLAIVQINFWVNLMLASGMAVGSIAALVRAWTIMLLPQGLIAQSVATAVFPTFSAQVATGDRDQLRETFNRVLRSILFLSFPAMIGLILLRLPIVQIIYQRGEFTLADSEATAWALLFYGLGLVSHSLVEVITRGFYAMHDTRTPVLVGGITMLLNIGLSLLLTRFIGDPAVLVPGAFAGLALANTIATTLEALVLLWLIRDRVGGLEGNTLLPGLLRTGLASAVMAAVIYGTAMVVGSWPLLLSLAILIGAGGAAFWGSALLLHSEEAHLFTGFVMRRLRRAVAG